MTKRTNQPAESDQGPAESAAPVASVDEAAAQPSDQDDDREDDPTLPPDRDPPPAAPSAVAAVPEEIDELEAALTELEAELAEANDAAAVLERRKAEIVRARDDILEAREAQRDPNHTMTEIQRYLLSQQAQREARGEQMRRVRESGVDLNALLPQRPPVDAVRARKKRA